MSEFAGFGVIRRRSDPPPVVIPLSAAETIMRDACEEFCCTKQQLVGMSRMPRFVRARVYAIRRMSEELGLSTTKIGQYLHKDHTTVLYHLLKASLD